MHIAHTQNRNKRQLWMGLKYRSQEWKRENGWWEHKATPVMKTILSKSQKTKSEQLVWDAADLKRLLGGEPLGEDMWRREVSEGQGVFLTIKDGIDSDKWPGFEVLESREAVERGLGGTVLLRVWPSRPRREGEGEIPEGERETVEAAQEQAGRLGKAREGPTSTIL